MLTAQSQKVLCHQNDGRDDRTENYLNGKSRLVPLRAVFKAFLTVAIELQQLSSLVFLGHSS